MITRARADAVFGHARILRIRGSGSDRRLPLRHGGAAVGEPRLSVPAGFLVDVRERVFFIGTSTGKRVVG
ncbi:MAG: hypothetical protein KatS3mg132_588 [Limisphaera sp.]|nr:MAG: hypothetical protein KatS3mg132_588 [Limisphaera sp.]